MNLLCSKDVNMILSDIIIMSDKIKQFKTDQSTLRNKIYDMSKTLVQLKDELQKLEKDMYYLCKHEWTKDRNACRGDLVNRYCTKCGLWNYRY
jgi:hypothetical protein